VSQEGHRPSTKRPASRHPVNKVMYDEAPMGARIADAVTSFMGSWRFIILQTVIVVVWISGNIYLLFHYDPYPFILLNLAFSTQAAYAAPLILLAQTRQADRDKVHAEADAQHREALAQMSIQKQELIERHSEELKGLIQQNTSLTEETKKLAERIDGLTAELHKTVCRKPD
jgi:uncharacterized membrane protein